MLEEASVWKRTLSCNKVIGALSVWNTWCCRKAISRGAVRLVEGSGNTRCFMWMGDSFFSMCVSIRARPAWVCSDSSATLTAPLGSWCTPRWSCPGEDQSGRRGSPSRHSAPCRLQPQCGPPSLCGWGVGGQGSGRDEERVWGGGGGSFESVTWNNQTITAARGETEWVSASMASPRWLTRPDLCDYQRYCVSCSWSSPRGHRFLAA